MSDAVSQLVTVFTAGMQALMLPSQQPTLLPSMPAVLPQQPITEPPSTKVMDMDAGQWKWAKAMNR